MRSIILLALLSITSVSIAQDVYEKYRDDWLLKAEKYTPDIIAKNISPQYQIKVFSDTTAFQNLNSNRVSDIDQFYGTALKKNEHDLILDFGLHLVGQVSITIKPTIPLHGPAQFRFVLGETLSEVHEPFSDYKGTLTKAWLQEEILTIRSMPTTITLPHRYAFRYLKIEILSSASDLDFFITDVSCESVSSAKKDMVSTTHKLPADFTAISDVSLKTLHDCMQTVFEDGPKRDQRQWIGDFKLQALANYYSFKNIDLVKRGLYLIAATAGNDGMVYGTLFERPSPHPQSHIPIDYCILFNTMLLDYYYATNDKELINDLWIVAAQQTRQIVSCIDEEGRFTPLNNWWYFIDWNMDLEKTISLHGIINYGLNETLELAKIMDKQDELGDLPSVIMQMKKYARLNYFNKESGLFVRKDSTKQVSVASQTWMILSETVTPREGFQLFEKLESYPELVKPVSPYMYHYVLEALIACNRYKEAKDLLMEYWGGMVAKGADTFWEVYDSDDDFISPYGSHLMNSYCHAWSCTPVYFIRKYEKSLFENIP